MTEAARSHKPAGRSTFGTLVFLFFAPTVWGLHLGLVYAVQGAVCAIAARGGPLAPWMAVGAAGVLTALAWLGLTFQLLAPRLALKLFAANGWDEPTRRLLRQLSAVLCVLSILAVGLAAAPVLFVPTCPSLR